MNISFKLLYPVLTISLSSSCSTSSYASTLDKAEIKLESQKGISAHAKVILHGEINMLSLTAKEVGLSLYSSNLPSLVKDVKTGSPAYFADIKANDKILAANFKDNKLCLSVNRAGTPYYTEIRLPAANDTTGVMASPGTNNSSRTSNAQPNSKQLIAIGFRFSYGDMKVTYVDPKSDLYGKVRINDIYMSSKEDLMPPANGQDLNLAYPIFKQNGALHQYPCRRKPIEFFASDMAQQFRTDIGAVYKP